MHQTAPLHSILGVDSLFESRRFDCGGRYTRPSCVAQSYRGFTGGARLLPTLQPRVLTWERRGRAAKCTAGAKGFCGLRAGSGARRSDHATADAACNVDNMTL